MGQAVLTAYSNTGTILFNTDTHAPICAGVLRFITIATDTEASRATTMRKAGTFTRMFHRITSNGTTTGSTARFRKNGANGNQNFSIGAGATGEFEDPSNSDTVAVNDVVNYRLTVGATAGMVMSTCAVTFENSTAGETTQILGFLQDRTPSFNSATQYYGPNDGDSNATESLVHGKVPFPCVATGLQLFVKSNPRVSDSTLTFRVAGADKTQTFTITAGATGLLQDTTHSDLIAAGERISLGLTNGAGGGTLGLSNAIVHLTTLDSTFLLPSGTALATNITAGTTSYYPFGGRVAFASETDVRTNVPFATVVSRFWMNVSANATTSPSTVTFRVNAGATALSFSIGAGATGEFENVVDQVAVAADDDIDYQVVNGGGGTLTFREVSAAGSKYDGRYVIGGTTHGSPTLTRSAFAAQQASGYVPADFAPAAVPDFWTPRYPDLLTLRVLPVALRQALAYTPEAVAAAFNTWWGPGYPDRIEPRLRLHAALQQALAYYPLPYVAVNLLSAWAFYPDFARRATLPPALMPSYSYGTLDPIPNPPVTYVIEDRVIIGQNPSIDISAYPTIGGGQNWS